MDAVKGVRMMAWRMGCGLVALGVSSAVHADPCGAAIDPARRMVAEAAMSGTTDSPQPAGQGIRVLFEVDPHPVRSGLPLRLRGVVCGPARLLRVDADMPAHRHGMNYRPTLRFLDGDGFEAEGLLLHMPGRWRIRFEVLHGGQRLWLDHAVELR